MVFPNAEMQNDIARKIDARMKRHGCRPPKKETMPLTMTRLDVMDWLHNQGRVAEALEKGVYPRVCGGARSLHHAICRVDGLSPRVRGSQTQSDLAEIELGSIPACAGEPLQGKALIYLYNVK